MFAADRNTSRMNLREARIAEESATTVSTPDRCSVGAFGVGRKIEDVAVTTCCQDHNIRGVRINGAGYQVARNDAARFAVDKNKVQHLAARMHLHAASRFLLLKRLISSEQKLLASLAARIEGARNLHTSEGTRVEQPAVFTGKRDSLGHALVNDIDAELRQAVDVTLARAKVSAFHGVVKKAEDAVAVIAVILRGIYAALCGDGVRAARTVLEAEAIHPIALLRERSSCRGTGQARAHDNHGVFAAVCRIDQLEIKAGFFPLLLNWAGRNFGFEHLYPCGGLEMPFPFVSATNPQALK